MPSSALGDRTNMAYAGTAVTYALSVGEWMIALGAATTVLPVLDLTKRWVGREGTTREQQARDG